MFPFRRRVQQLQQVEDIPIPEWITAEATAKASTAKASTAKASTAKASTAASPS
jgi:hypothetical protein